MEVNSEMILKIWRKGKLNGEKICKNTEENCEKI